MIEQIPFVTRNPISGAYRQVTDDMLAAAYLVPEPRAFDIGAAIAADSHPWAESLRHAPAETIAAVTDAFEALVAAVPSMRPEQVDLSRLDPDSRLFRHVSALLGLWQDLNGGLPCRHAIWREVLEADPDRAVEALPLVDARPPDSASAALGALHHRLITDHGLAPESIRTAWAARQVGHVVAAPADTSLGHAQRHLMDPEAGRRPLDDTLLFLKVANMAHEAETAAALVQGMLDAGRADRQEAFAILVPDDPVFCHYLEQAFHMRGLSLSGLPATDMPVDLAGETLLNFLLALRRPAPVMVLASLYISPLMPWDAQTGRRMAREVMRGRYNFREAGLWPEEHRRFYTILRESDVSDAKTLHRALDALVRVARRDDDMTAAATALEQRAALVRGAVADRGPIDWDRLSALAAPRSRRHPRRPRHVEGVSVFLADREPWRPVRHLVVTGFAAGFYPRPVGGNPLFLDSELDELQRKAGLRLPRRAETIASRIALFNRQMNAARDGITFLCRRHDGSGKPLAAPAALALIARTSSGIPDYQDLPLALDDIPADQRLFPTRAIGPLRDGGYPQIPQDGVVRLDRDLLALRKDGEGRMRPQSPSRLETLLVSPLVWTLNELGAETVVWAPESLDVLLKGNLAHDIMERLFPANHPLPEPEDIPDRVAKLTDQAIRRLAPFLQSLAWRLERIRFQQEMTQAARNWRNMLEGLQAEILANEETLRGEAQGILLEGRCDCILRMPDGTLMIIDHKRSASGRRRERMQAGWDLQLALYREALRRPAVASQELHHLLDDQPIAVAYHTMNDGVLLSHGLVPPAPPPARLEVLENDIAGEAMARLRKHLAEVGAGTIRLNRESDEDFFRKTAKLSPYALDQTILARIFVSPDGEGNDR